MFGIGGWTKIVGGMPLTYIYFTFPDVILTQEGSRNRTKEGVLAYNFSKHINGHWIILTQEGSRNRTKHKCIGEQVLHLRWRMTKCSGHLRTDSSLIVQNWKCSWERFRAQRRIYFLFFLGSLSSRNRKMRELFFMPLKKIFGKIFHPR